MGQAGRPLRVLMAHWDGAGNLSPQRALARPLKRRGHEVHVLSHDTVAERIRADGAVFHRLPTADRRRGVRTSAWLSASRTDRFQRLAPLQASGAAVGCADTVRPGRRLAPALDSRA
jgi:UDP:flavonoid glycosyltransferase YjiC (YdhE family)